MNKIKIVALGDSITQGFPYSENDSWVSIVSQKYNLRIINRGICGDYTSGMFMRFKRDVINHNPDAVTILGGYNDAFSGIDCEKVSGNIAEICSAAKKHNIKAILCLPTPVTIPSVEKLLSEYRNWILDYAQNNNVPVINFYKTFIDSQKNTLIPGTTTDGAHPTIKGYKLMATAVDLKKIFPNEL